MTSSYYKVLGEDGSPCHGGHGTWSLPDGETPGDWMPRIKRMEPCASGYHICREQDLVHWLGPVIYTAEYRGEVIEDKHKIVVGEARLLRRIEEWDERTARLFACDCAERVLGNYEVKYPDDSRVRDSIEVARLYADGSATLDDLEAAYSAALSAAYRAAYRAADSAAYSAADSAYSAAYRAADSAAYSAADSAAYSAADSAYSAAYRAADSAAYSAADSAYSAAASALSAADRAAASAALSAAYSAYSAADRAAEREWQTARLVEYLRGEVR